MRCSTRYGEVLKAIRPAIPQQRSLPSRSTILRLQNPSQSRQYATATGDYLSIPPLGHNNKNGKFFSEMGVPGLMTKETFNSLWQDYQGSLVEEISETLEEWNYQHKTPKEIHIDTSRQPDQARLYNISAMAHFNHFFFQSLAREKTVVPQSLSRAIEENFADGLEGLREEMLECGAAIFGNGFVWLMKEPRRGNVPGGLRILCTYNAGSPYSEAYKMRQDRDMATYANASMSSISEARRLQPQNNVGVGGQYSAANRSGVMPLNALQGQPLLCLNVWQHVWVPDYGVMGKNIYLSNWWDRIDWEQVSERYNQIYELSDTRPGYLERMRI
ncbi:hypothetical protein BT93_L0839 [Corymbia citriodora subsp. variegata]|uniref:Manganese/iron superoxide dismutase C-terminal domain-containing protein n=1 Tax=Corymbia citriodora subsp. variegata TaxID=360336 RepID=A0A8T0CIT4_CORYI|nr:hypothetical protein BT93_L0839 [Corymbia citriodora subsp. variegata]